MLAGGVALLWFFSTMLTWHHHVDAVDNRVFKVRQRCSSIVRGMFQIVRAIRNLESCDMSVNILPRKEAVEGESR